MFMFQASLLKCPIIFRIKPRPLIFALGPLWSGPYLHLHPPVLMGPSPLWPLQLHFGHSHPPCSAVPGHWHLLFLLLEHFFALGNCLVTPSSWFTLLPKLDFLCEACADLTNQTFIFLMVSQNTVTCPVLSAVTTVDFSAWLWP